MKVFSLKIENLSIFVLLMIIVSGLYFTIQKQNTVETMLPVNAKVVILDAGHGGWDPGKQAHKAIMKKISICKLPKN